MHHHQSLENGPTTSSLTNHNDLTSIYGISGASNTQSLVIIIVKRFHFIILENGITENNRCQFFLN
ncbi:hypothetical protein BpHYR1_031039 [Brachionus plicatilis]|uniref:Uncharacterized protein n=1 Tax=Brachionus plicatilis TaxID=10195 RepID=A0A3M7PRL8_BRAPC|nr:hypothetical protein BpHYR1_031039 [Brachionus plicatilis]